MMKKLPFYALILITISACTKQNQNTYLSKPVASFIVKNDNCKGPCNISFANTSKGSYDMTYLWDFGDGDTSRLESPTHTYERGGVYNVQLTAQDKAGISFSYQKVSVQADLLIGALSLCRVERITYLKVPPTKPDGKPWDDLPNNDTLPELQWFVRDTNRILIRGRELSELVNFEQKLLPFVVPREGLSGSMRQFSQYYTLVIQDADIDGGEIMGEFRFRPVDHFPPQPDNATIASSLQTEFMLKTPYGLEILVLLNWQ